MDEPWQFSTLVGNLGSAADWWRQVSESEAWQTRTFYALAALYGVIALVALIQLIRIELRVPEYGWTTQKVFHLLNFVVNIVRAVVFTFRRDVQSLDPKILQYILLDLPGLVFFTTYSLLVLFWAEIYHQASGLSTDNLRPVFLITNAAIYVIQGSIWVYLWLWPSDIVDEISKLFFAGVSLVAAIGFLRYGGRLFDLLRRFPIESKGRRKKLREVGSVTAICFTCFVIRAVMMAFAGFDRKADLDVMNHPILNAIYYTCVEIIPSALVLYILRKLPPKRVSGQYHPIP
eukprot:TRINITY_DN20854_c0_g1_i1.p1 TRINITY_DN20854_c0_g1~~TRINITY_DN20854_c0_g1_i1.p1  ORF type:complete len:289 (-),score=32.12 TRINITY_DN20854_c0_g1_i1:619-1485(-)